MFDQHACFRASYVLIVSGRCICCDIASCDSHVREDALKQRLIGNLHKRLLDSEIVNLHLERQGLGLGVDVDSSVPVSGLFPDWNRSWTVQSVIWNLVNCFPRKKQDIQVCEFFFTFSFSTNYATETRIVSKDHLSKHLGAEQLWSQAQGNEHGQVPSSEHCNRSQDGGQVQGDVKRTKAPVCQEKDLDPAI